MSAPLRRKMVRPIAQRVSDLVRPEELQLFQRDLETMRQIQAQLMTQKPPEIEGYDFGVHYSPGGKAGGNFYDFLQLDPDHLGILVADISGRGLSGSLLMVETRAVIRSLASMSDSPREVLIAANRVLRQNLQHGMFVAIFFGVLEISTGRLRIASAGQMPMLIWKQKVRRCFVATPSGMVLGAASEEMFTAAIKEDWMALGPADRFVLYTPGVTDLQDPRGNEFGRARLVRSTFNNAHLTSENYLKTLMAELELHRDGVAQADHITLVTGRRIPADELDWSDRPTERRTRT